MIKIEAVKEFVAHTIDTNGDTYTRYSSMCWTVTMGESEESVYNCEELEKAYQEYISNTGIKRKDLIAEKWKGVMVHTPIYPDGAIMIKVDDNIERPIAIIPLPVGGHKKGTELQFFNASLIAASPELLNACEDALSFFTPDDDIYNTLFDVIVKAQRNFKSKKIMSIKIDKKSYEKLIKEDLDFLNKHCPDSLELDHIKLIVCNSIDWYYPGKEIGYALRRIERRLTIALKKQKDEGKPFLTDKEIDDLIDNILKEEQS